CAKLACSGAGAHTVTAKPIRRPSSAIATATGLDPHTTICGCGSTGSTKTSMVPWLGQRLLAKRTPARSSPAARPWSCSGAGGGPLVRQRVGGRHRARRGLAVGGRLVRGLEPRRGGAATADPALGDRSVRQDHRLGAGLGGGGGDGTHHRRQRERLAFGLHG